MKHLRNFESFSTAEVYTNTFHQPDDFRYIYHQNFMTETDFLTIEQELSKFEGDLVNSMDSRDGILRYNLPIQSELVETLLKKYESDLKKLVNNDLIYLAKNFPIELRKYTTGCHMKPHKDTQIYKVPQYECVFTISNSTDSITSIEDEHIKSNPNSLIIVRAEGPIHHVSEVTKGERNFLKFILTETDDFL